MARDSANNKDGQVVRAEAKAGPAWDNLDIVPMVPRVVDIVGHQDMQCEEDEERSCQRGVGADSRQADHIEGVQPVAQGRCSVESVAGWDANSHQMQVLLCLQPGPSGHIQTR